MAKRRLTRREVVLARRLKELDAAEERLQQAEVARLERERIWNANKRKADKEIKENRLAAAKLVLDAQVAMEKLKADTKKDIDNQCDAINAKYKIRKEELDAAYARLKLSTQQLSSADADYRIRAAKLAKDIQQCKERENQLELKTLDWMTNRQPMPSDPKVFSSMTLGSELYSYYMQQDQRARLTGFTQLADGRMGYLGLLLWDSAVSNHPVPLDPDWFYPNRMHAVYCWYAECVRQAGFAQVFPERQRIWLARRDIAADEWRKLARA